MLSKDQLHNLRKLVKEKEGTSIEKREFTLDNSSEVKVLSKQAMTLKQRILDIKEKNLETFSKITRSIAICSGKGGVGKSNLTVNLAILLSKLGKKTIVIDADLGLANDDILLGIRPKHHLFHFLCGQKKINEIIMEGPCGMKLLPGGSGISELANIREMERAQIINGLVSLSKEADIVLIDTSAGISKNVMNFVCAAEDTILVVNPEPTSLLDAFGMLKAIVKNGKKSNIHVVVNRALTEKEAEETYERLKKTASKFLFIELHYGGFIYDDKEVVESIKKQKPFVLRAPECKASKSMENVLKRIFGLTGQNVYKNNNEGNSLLTFFKKLVEVFEN